MKHAIIMIVAVIAGPAIFVFGPHLLQLIVGCFCLGWFAASIEKLL
jgi:hypothetical protein